MQPGSLSDRKGFVFPNTRRTLAFSCPSPVAETEVSTVILMDRNELNAALKDKLLALLPGPSRLEPKKIPGLALTRIDEGTKASRCFYRPMVALVVQGYKHSIIGDHEADYGKNECVVVGVDMPGVFHVAEASPTSPFLSVSVSLDRRIISQLVSQMPSIIAESSAQPNPVMTAEAPAELLDVFLRLVSLLEHPARIPVLAPLYLQELHFYLLSGVQGGCLRLFGTGGTQASQIAQAISWLREHYKSPLRMEELAKLANMAPSTFNRHFKEVTSISPLQFQKRLRLYEAERLMLMEGKDAATAAYLVGYESASQFNREYKRQFGEPPHRDVAKKSS